MVIWRIWILALAALGGCSGGGNAAFRASGEVIAFGGGDGGAAHACSTCHGVGGEGDGRLAPRLAGLNAGYLHRQLDDFANGRREHADMRAIVRRLSGEDRAKVAAYYAGLPAGTANSPVASTLYQDRCASCHGVRGEGRGPGNPALAGQPAAYVEAQMEAWRMGRRRGEGEDIMMAVSRSLAPEQLAELAGPVDAASPRAHRLRAQAASR